jgi:hypothetical protein
MSAYETRLAKLRAEGTRLYREYEAIYTLINQGTTDIKRGFTFSKDALITRKKPELRGFVLWRSRATITQPPGTRF